MIFSKIACLPKYENLPQNNPPSMKKELTFSYTKKLKLKYYVGTMNENCKKKLTPSVELRILFVTQKRKLRKNLKTLNKKYKNFM